MEREDVFQWLARELAQERAELDARRRLDPANVISMTSESSPCPARQILLAQSCHPVSHQEAIATLLSI